jgi:Leucine-rich repeat (LRR) protein
MKPIQLLIALIFVVLSACVSKQQDKKSRILFSLKELSNKMIYNDIDSMPKDLDSVFRLDLSRKQLKKIPEIVSKLTHLQELNLKNNEISNLDGFENLNSLQILNIGMNNFKEFPIEITKYRNLKILDISWSDIETFPTNFFIDNTQIEELDMTSMFEFDFKSCLDRLHFFKNLKRLNLGNNQIQHLTLQFDKLENLEEFGYIGQESIDIVEICSKLASCKKLKTVHLSANNITILPNEICLLKNLENLNLFQNKIKVLPTDIAKMKYLKEINLIDNPIEVSKIKDFEVKLPQTNIIY